MTERIAMKKITVRKTGPLRLTSTAASLYAPSCGIAVTR
jgi:hypothetical protein